MVTRKWRLEEMGRFWSEVQRYWSSTQNYKMYKFWGANKQHPDYRIIPYSILESY